MVCYSFATNKDKLRGKRRIRMKRRRRKEEEETVDFEFGRVSTVRFERTVS